MKKINLLLLFTCLLFFGSKSFAVEVQSLIPQKVIVQMENDFSSKEPPQTFKVVLDKDYTIPNSKKIEKGAVLTLETVKVSQQKRGKINASAKARITEVYIPNEDKTIEVTNPDAIVKVAKYEKVDVADKVLDTGTTVANYFVSNISIPINLARGAVLNETGNRFTSAGKKAYEKSVLSYISEGQPIDLKKGDLATLLFFIKNPEEQQKAMEDLK